MPRIAYEEWSPHRKSLAVVAHAVRIIDEYRAEGYVLTLRQLFYQFVARDLLPNSNRSYKRLGELVAKGRMAGYIDWDSIEDRTRNLTRWRTYDSPESAIDRLRRSFVLEKWAEQPAYVEVWVEKEALAGVFERICSELQVPFFANRGYVSLSEMWSASQRLTRIAETKTGRKSPGGWDETKQVVILHFGDHDPSGIDMTRDIGDRTELFGAYDAPIEVWRIALNMDQVEEYRPPPNPAKVTDSRADDYIARFGRSSWELDALEPRILSDLVRSHVDELRDQELWDAAVEREEEAIETLRRISERYDDVAALVNDPVDDPED